MNLMRGPLWLAVLGMATACTGQVKPDDLSATAALRVPEATSEKVSTLVEAPALSGHLDGVGVPVGSEVVRATYAPTHAEIVLKGVKCGKRLDAAYALAPLSLKRTCQGDRLTLREEGEALPAWNPWGEASWHAGPLDVLPEVKVGDSFRPPELLFEGVKAEARLTPKNPNAFVDVIGASLADDGWVVRPVPGGHTYSKAGWTARVDQDGAVVTVQLEGPPVEPRALP